MKRPALAGLPVPAGPGARTAPQRVRPRLSRLAFLAEASSACGAGAANCARALRSTGCERGPNDPVAGVPTEHLSFDPIGVPVHGLQAGGLQRPSKKDQRILLGSGTALAGNSGPAEAEHAPQAHRSDPRVSVLSPPVAVLWSSRSRTTSPGDTTMSLTLAAATSISRSMNHTAITNTSAEWAAPPTSNAARSAKHTKRARAERGNTSFRREPGTPLTMALMTRFANRRSNGSTSRRRSCSWEAESRHEVLLCAPERQRLSPPRSWS